MKKGLVSIIIVSWNGLHWLKECLPSLSEQTYKQIEIIIIDNASSDGTIEWVTKRYPEVNYHLLPQNVGFAQGNNIGYSHANGEYIYFLNNDTLLDKHAIEQLINSISKDKSIAGGQSKILLQSNHSKLDTIGAFLTKTGFLYHNHFGEKDRKELDQALPLYTCKGASMIIKKRVLDEVLVDSEVFDSRFFAYFEETDLCHRIWLRGYQLIYIPTAVIYHYMGGSSSTLQQPFVQFHSFKNRIASYIKNLGTYQLMTILPLHMCFCMGYVGFMLVKGNFSMIATIFNAMFWNISHLTQTLKKRRYIQHTIRTVPDSKFFPLILKNVSLGYYYSFSKHFS